MYIVNSGSVFNFCTLEVITWPQRSHICLDTQMYHDTGNLQTIWLLIITKTTYYQQQFRKYF